VLSKVDFVFLERSADRRVVLMSMVSRECWRKQGAASLLIDWGVKKAREDGVPAYLEASVTGKPVYEKAGFREVGEHVPWDMRPHGIPVVFNIAKMAYIPESDFVKHPHK